MGVRAVKPKLPQKWGLWLLVIAAILVSCAAWAGLLPPLLVEAWYSRWIFPAVSRVLTPLARSVPFSWLDVLVPAAAVFLAWCAVRRRFGYLAGVVAATYLIFALTWGLNYQRMPLVSKLDYDESRVNADAVRSLREEAASRLNALFDQKEASITNEAAIVAEAARRVTEVVGELDGVRFPLPSVKTSHVLNPLFRAGGTSGMFNPFGYEALVTEPLLEVERPVVVMHEIAHVMGYANEGEANFVAFLAAIHSVQPLSEYSGWLYLWLYLRTSDSDTLLDPGPRADLRSIYEKSRREQVEWVRRASSRSLDTFLRANRVPEGIASYADIVRLAAGTRDSWSRFVGAGAPMPAD